MVPLLQSLVGVGEVEAKREGRRWPDTQGLMQKGSSNFDLLWRSFSEKNAKREAGRERERVKGSR